MDLLIACVVVGEAVEGISRRAWATGTSIWPCPRTRATPATSTPGSSLCCVDSAIRWSRSSGDWKNRRQPWRTRLWGRPKQCASFIAGASRSTSAG
eukprot:scaffold990_cov279-Pinguiococcus_pyrenoidosus.AAC.8